MPWGKHIGKRLIDVPAKYLLKIREDIVNLDKGLLDYIEDNMDVLLKELSE